MYNTYNWHETYVMIQLSCSSTYQNHLVAVKRIKDSSKEVMIKNWLYEVISVIFLKNF